tara:strand:+ start:1503 stop:2369 length:867 start_codon:yes stop_codon:yes gene_type:complete
MKKLLILLFSLMLSFNSYGEWTELWSEPGTETTWHVDINTVIELDDLVYFWWMISDDEESEADFIQVDCDLRRMKYLQKIFYDKPNAEGESKYENGDDSWKYVPPNTIDGFFIEMSCDLVNLSLDEREKWVDDFVLLTALTEPMTMSVSIEKLQDYLIENPNDFQALKMLGLAQVSIGNVNDSIESFERAFKVNPNDIDLLLQYASAIAANQDGMFYGKSKILIAKALSLDPQSIQVLYFAGIVLVHQSDLDGAIGYWQKALYLMPDSHPDRNVIEEALNTVLNLQVK